MALITNIPALTAQQVASMSETLFEGFFNDPVLNSLVNVQNNIKADKQIVIFKRHTGLAGAKVSACPTPTNSTWGIDTVEKTWQPKPIGDKFSECWTTFQDTFMQWFLNAGIDKADLTSTDMAAFIVEQLDDLIAEVYQRHFWFGDKGIVAGTNNNLSAGQLKFFNVIDGIFAQGADIVTANSARLTSGTGLISDKNAEITYADQKFDSTDTTNQMVSKTLDQMWYDADIRLRGLPKASLTYYVTQSVHDQLERERKAISGIPMPYERQESGIDTLVWNGIKVVPVQLWDRMITSYFGNDATPTYSVNPHRVILAPSSNLLLGTESTSALGELDVWHSKDDEAMYAKFLCAIDAKIALDNMIQFAY